MDRRRVLANRRLLLAMVGLVLVLLAAAVVTQAATSCVLQITGMGPNRLTCP